MRNFAKSIRKYPFLTERLFLITFIFFCVSCVCTIAWPFVYGSYTLIFSQNWCENYALGDNISCGEESLFRFRSKSLNNTTLEFENAFASWNKGEFKKAVVFFDKHRKQNKNENQNDGEALIYLNNAKLMQAQAGTKRESYTIAVIVPANRGISEAMLRGAAQVQDDFNNDPKNPGLKIIIVNDSNDNDPGNAKQLINKLLSKQDIIAVIGHYASDVVQEALPVYQQRKVVLISPVSAARQDILDGHKKYESNFLFKTNTDVTHQMDKLIEALKTLGINIPQDKVAIFYNKTSTFSISTFNYLQSKFGQNAKNKIIEKQISYLPKVDNELNDVKQKGAKALILIPDGQLANTNNGANSKSLKNAMRLIEANKDQLPVLGQTVLYDFDILQLLKNTKYLDKFRIITTWSHVSSPNKNVVPRANELWGTGDVGVQFGWYYDATVVLTKALTNALKDKSFMNDSVEKQRLAIQQQLKSDSFQVTEGASGTISFDQDGDRKEDTSQIFKVGLVPTDCRTEGAMFLPVDYDYKKSGCPRPDNPQK